MNELNYEFQIELNWLGDRKESDLQSLFSRLRNQHGQQLIRTKVFEGLPRRLWEKILKHLKMNETCNGHNYLRKWKYKLIQELISARFQVSGKTMNKEEFVTCGGVRLKEVNFKKMESRLSPIYTFRGMPRL